MADMSPWEALGWFQAAQFSSISLPGNTDTVIATGDPQRVVLMLGSAPTAAQWSASINAITGASQGFAINSQVGPLIITQAQYGPLASMPWHGFSQGGSTAQVLTVSLRDWPAARASTPNAQLQATLALTRALEELTRALRQR